MKVIFLDIDGVLNCHGMVGIDNDKVKRLKEIVKSTGAKIVLISTWKTDWQKLLKEQQEYMADYLDKKLSRQGLVIMDKTEDTSANHGQGILDWLDGKNVESFVILDDEDFDYQEANIADKVVKTVFIMTMVVCRTEK